MTHIKEHQYTFLSYLAEFFLEWEIFHTKFVEKKRTQNLCSATFLQNRAVYEIMWKKCSTARRATDDNKIRRMRIACWTPKATNTHSEHVTLLAFPCNNGGTNAPHVACLPCWFLHISERNSKTRTQCTPCAVCVLCMVHVMAAFVSPIN
jgi:hypothetical protein